MSESPAENSETFRLTIIGGGVHEIRRDETVLSALARSGVALSAPCGGRGVCGKCRVKLRSGTLGLAGAAELESDGVFSACRGRALSDLSIELPDENGLGRECGSRGESGAEKHARQNGKKILRAGAALDIGTTTVLLELVDLDTGESLETISALNAQRIFGADVMSRIGAARTGKTKELFGAVNHQVETMFRHCIEKWGLPGIERCTVSGNTAMLHLFCGADPSSMGEVPFKPVFLEERRFLGSELFLSAANITLLPGISAFVGADIVSGLSFLDIAHGNGDALFVDIGTNGEMALWKKSERRFLCCSTAAGPCFEGAEISSGMGALPGAINAISVGADSKLAFSTLGNVPPKGICGTGLIDAMAAMKKTGAIDETGALADEFAAVGFPITEGIAVSQKDIRQFQLAKSAILSGIKVLCKKAGIEDTGELDAIFIAGALGFYLDVENAVTSGLLPSSCAGSAGKQRTKVCGNTSLAGAARSLLDPDFLPNCRDIAARSGTAELASDPDFAEAFAENMYF